MKRRFTVICEWQDTQDNDHCDADEIQVLAENAGQAISAAQAKWKKTIATKWPGLALEKVWILTPALRRSLV
jgi:hypothetical protein